jgi:hypothetical protein
VAYSTVVARILFRERWNEAPTAAVFPFSRLSRLAAHKPFVALHAARRPIDTSTS